MGGNSSKEEREPVVAPKEKRKKKKKNGEGSSVPVREEGVGSASSQPSTVSSCPVVEYPPSLACSFCGAQFQPQGDGQRAPGEIGKDLCLSCGLSAFHVDSKEDLMAIGNSLMELPPDHPDYRPLRFRTVSDIVRHNRGVTSISHHPRPEEMLQEKFTSEFSRNLGIIASGLAKFSSQEARGVWKNLRSYFHNQGLNVNRLQATCRTQRSGYLHSMSASMADILGIKFSESSSTLLVADLLFESMIYSSSEVDKCAEDVHLACSVLFDLSMLLFRIAQLDLSFLGRR